MFPDYYFVWMIMYKYRGHYLAILHWNNYLRWFTIIISSFLLVPCRRGKQQWNKNAPLFEFPYTSFSSYHTCFMCTTKSSMADKIRVELMPFLCVEIWHKGNYKQCSPGKAETHAFSESCSQCKGLYSSFCSISTNA